VHVLTPLQYDVCRLEAVGLPRDEIARRLGTGKPTVAALVCRIRRRLGVRTRRELAAALLDCVAQEWDYNGRVTAEGLHIGDAVRITGGYFVGRTGVYAGAANSTQLRIQINGGTFALARKYIERINQGAPHA